MLGVCLLSVNLALNKAAYQQYPYRPNVGKYDASKAVDGLKSNLSVDGGQCAVSDLNKRTAIWWVNLRSIYSIHHINIFYIKGNLQGKPLYLYNSVVWCMYYA